MAPPKGPQVDRLTPCFELTILTRMTKTPEDTKMSRLDGAKLATRAYIEASLIESFKNFVRELNYEKLEKIYNLNYSNVFFPEKEKNTTNTKNNKEYNISIRNQIAYAKGRERALNKISQGYDLLESNKVCELLAITRQALSKKVSSGQIIAYTVNSKKKLYPSFQFKKNKCSRNIKELIEATVVDPADTKKMNMLLGFLLTKINFSNVGEKDNIKFKYELIDNKDALNIIIREFKGIGRM